MPKKNKDLIESYHDMIASGNYEDVNAIIEAGLDINSCSSEEEAPVETACLHDQESMALYLIEKGVDVFWERDGFSLLHSAASVGFLKLAKKLIDLGVDVNKPENNESFYTPLCWAVQEGYQEMVKLLLLNGAQVNRLECDVEESAQLPIHIAVGNNDINIIDTLINAGADVNSYSEEAGTPLHLAASWGNFESAEMLIGNSADPFVLDSEGKMPIYYAKKYKRLNVVKFLKDVMSRNQIK